jgi:putative phosphoribosyl transferase
MISGWLAPVARQRSSPGASGEIRLPIANRESAGQALAERLVPRAGTIVLALPRGGIPVAVPIARLLHAPLDVLLVRKLGIPGQPELAAGAIACGGVRSLNPGLADHLDPRELARIEQHEGLELIRRERAYRDGRKPVVLSGKRVILVDDGAATGASMSAAIKAARGQGATWVTVAVPVCAPDTASRLRSLADEFVCLACPEPFVAVGAWYRDFGQIDDACALHQLHAFNPAALPP